MIQYKLTSAILVALLASTGCSKEDDAKGPKQTFTVTVEASGTPEVDGKKGELQTLPPIRFEVEVTTVAKEPRLEAKLKVTELDVLEAENVSADYVRRFRKAEKKMPEVSGKIVVEKDGTLSILILKAKRGVTNQQEQLIATMRGALARLLVPAEKPFAVAGEAYSRDREIEDNGLKLLENLLVKVVEEKGGVIRLEAKGRRRADAENDGVAPVGVYADSIKLKEYEETSHIELERRLDSAFPSKAQIRSVSVIAMEIDQAGQKNQVHTRSTLQVKVESGAAE